MLELHILHVYHSHSRPIFTVNLIIAFIINNTKLSFNKLRLGLSYYQANQTKKYIVVELPGQWTRKIFHSKPLLNVANGTTFYIISSSGLFQLKTKHSSFKV